MIFGSTLRRRFSEEPASLPLFQIICTSVSKVIFFAHVHLCGLFVVCGFVCRITQNLPHGFQGNLDGGQALAHNRPHCDVDLKDRFSSLSLTLRDRQDCFSTFFLLISHFNNQQKSSILTINGWGIKLRAFLRWLVSMNEYNVMRILHHLEPTWNSGHISQIKPLRRKDHHCQCCLYQRKDPF